MPNKKTKKKAPAKPAAPSRAAESKTDPKPFDKDVIKSIRDAQKAGKYGEASRIIREANAAEREKKAS